MSQKSNTSFIFDEEEQVISRPVRPQSNLLSKFNQPQHQSLLDTSKSNVQDTTENVEYLVMMLKQQVQEHRQRESQLSQYNRRSSGIIIHKESTRNVNNNIKKQSQSFFQEFHDRSNLALFQDGEGEHSQDSELHRSQTDFITQNLDCLSSLLQHTESLLSVYRSADSQLESLHAKSQTQEHLLWECREELSKLQEEQRVNHEVIRGLEAEHDRQLEERQLMEQQVREADLELKEVILEVEEAKREAARAQEAMLKVVRDHDLEVQRVTQQFEGEKRLVIERYQEQLQENRKLSFDLEAMRKQLTELENENYYLFSEIKQVAQEKENVTSQLDQANKQYQQAMAMHQQALRLTTSKKKGTKLIMPLSHELPGSDDEDNTKSVNNHILTEESREEPLRIKLNGQVPIMDIDTQSRIEKSRCLGNELHRLDFSNSAADFDPHNQTIISQKQYGYRNTDLSQDYDQQSPRNTHQRLVYQDLDQPGKPHNLTSPIPDGTDDLNSQLTEHRQMSALRMVKQVDSHRKQIAMHRNSHSIESQYLALTLSKEEFQNFLRLKYGEKSPRQRGDQGPQDAKALHKINPHKKINLAEFRQKRDFELLKQAKRSHHVSPSKPIQSQRVTRNNSPQRQLYVRDGSRTDELLSKVSSQEQRDQCFIF